MTYYYLPVCYTIVMIILLVVLYLRVSKSTYFIVIVIVIMALLFSVNLFSRNDCFLDGLFTIKE